MTGMRFTRVPRRFMISMSKGFSLKEREGERCGRMGVWRGYGRVTSGTDKIEACVYSEVRLVGPQRLLLLSHVRLMLVIDEVDNRGPGVAVVDIVTKARGIDDGQLGLELFLLQLGLDDFDLCQLVELLEVTAVVVLRGRQLGGK